MKNGCFRDPTISLKAKGLYALVQSYGGSTPCKATLKRQCKEGEAAFESAWQELKKSKYLKQGKTRLQDGTFCYEYNLQDSGK